VKYDAFVSQKLTRPPSTGLTQQLDLHPSLFPHQRDLTTWALRRGRAAIFADTGLGKSAMQLEWARLVAQHTGGKVLILAPLAVGAQTVREGARLGVQVKQVRYGGDVGDDEEIFVTNYDRLHHFDPTLFTGVVLDESSVIKSHDSKTFAKLTESFELTPFRLCATATPSPNDYTELGTHAEFLGVCSRVEMLSEYFVHDGGDTSVWRLKGHAKKAFWSWVATWGALLRKPSDLGYPNEGYDLPELITQQHIIPASPDEVRAQGLLFAEPAKGLLERRRARKNSLSERVRLCAETMAKETKEPWLVWCELNAESEALADSIPGAVEIRGSDDAILKERRLIGFASGEVRVLVSKPSIAGHGLNFQHCARIAFVGVSDSFEQTYQAIRRCWRFGQRRPVHVHFFASEFEGSVVDNLKRKERDAIAMAEQLSIETRDAVRLEIRGLTRDTNDYRPSVAMTRPSWLESA